jgi:permuted papain-like amidase YaeF/Yiix C92 family enzyme
VTTRLWHRGIITVGRTAWPAIRRLRRLVAWVARTGPELRLERRRGRMDGCDVLIRAVARSLSPLDLIVERGPLKVSDVFIPGHFKHVAVYLGPRLSMEIQWICHRHGRVGPVRRQLTVLEATRHGVRLAPVHTFFRGVDTFVVLRGKRASAAERHWVASRAADELGKEYDYLFDLSDHQRQFCCKLVSGLFPAMPFADLLRAGAALVPDDFVVPASRGDQRAPRAVMLVQDAIWTPAAQLSNALAALLVDDYPRGKAIRSDA